MALTPSDIEQKTFSTALRGYDLNEVDDFLDEMVATLKELNDQLADARSGMKTGDDSVAPRTPLISGGVDESAIGRALVAAQNAADRLLEEADEEASRIREEAKAEADSWVTERDARKAEAEREMDELVGRVANVRRELAVLATAVADRLDEMDAAIKGEPATEETVEVEETEERVELDVVSVEESAEPVDVTGDTDTGLEVLEEESSQ